MFSQCTARLTFYKAKTNFIIVINAGHYYYSYYHRLCYCQLKGLYDETVVFFHFSLFILIVIYLFCVTYRVVRFHELCFLSVFPADCIKDAISNRVFMQTSVHSTVLIRQDIHIGKHCQTQNKLIYKSL